MTDKKPAGILRRKKSFFTSPAKYCELVKTLANRKEVLEKDVFTGTFKWLSINILTKNENSVIIGDTRTSLAHFIPFPAQKPSTTDSSNGRPSN